MSVGGALAPAPLVGGPGGPAGTPLTAHRSAASAPRPRSRTRRLRELAAPLVVSLLAVCALTSSAALRLRETSDRDAQVTLAQVGSGLQRIATTPFELANGIASPAAAARLVDDGQATLARQLASLRSHVSPATEAALSDALRTLVGIEGEVRALLARTPGTRSGGRSVARLLALASASVSDGAPSSRTLSRAEARTRSATLTLQIASIATAAATVLLLLAAFWVIHRQSTKARTAAEELAAALGYSERHLARAQQVAGIGSWEWHTAGRRVIWSEEQAHLHGWSAAAPPATVEEFLGLIDALDRERVREGIATLRRDGTPLSVEYAVSGPAGSRLIHIRGDRLQSADGTVTGMLGTCQDVTERFRRVEAERANRAKSEFLSRMSHELRTPLNAILGFAQLLEMGQLDLRQRRNVEHISKAGGHLLALVDEVLEMSRIEAGEAALPLTPVAVAEIVKDAVDIVAPLAAGNGVRIEVDPLDGDARALADRRRLTQVLLNLLSNAIKYNHPGGRAHIAVTHEPGGRLAIAVSDDGRGIALELQARLFTPFDRLGAEQSDVSGAGLGLAASKAFVDAMNATLEVRSAPGAGSTFTVTLADAGTPDRAVAA